MAIHGRAARGKREDGVFQARGGRHEAGQQRRKESKIPY
jgi:hypothetical protein